MSHLYSTATTAAAAARTPTAGPETNMAGAAAVEAVGEAAEPELEVVPAPEPPVAPPVEDPMVEELAGEPGTPEEELDGPAAPELGREVEPEPEPEPELELEPEP
jgi:hypothetical protein